MTADAYSGTMRRLLVAMLAGLALILTGCSSPGDVSQVKTRFGESERFSRTDLEGAADAVFTYFAGFDNCVLLELTYDEAFSDRQIQITGPYGPELPEGGDVVVFNSSLVNTKPIPDENPRNTWTWWVVRTDPSQPWKVINYGVA